MIGDLDLYFECVRMPERIFMCFFNSPASSPAPLAQVQPIPPPVDPTVASNAAASARTDQAKKAQAAQGLASTINTSPLGVTAPAEVKKPGLYS
jgi:hypothetical protein